MRFDLSGGFFFSFFLVFFICKRQFFLSSSQKPVSFTSTDLSYLLKDTYDNAFQRRVYTDAEVVSQFEFDAKTDKTRQYRIEYRDHHQFVRIANAFGIMDDFKVCALLFLVPRRCSFGVGLDRGAAHSVPRHCLDVGRREKSLHCPRAAVGGLYGELVISPSNICYFFY